MTGPQASIANPGLQAQVQAALDRWLQSCYTKPGEYIVANANDLGEIWLSGLVGDQHIVDEAIHLARELPGVRRIFNSVTIMYTGPAIKL